MPVVDITLPIITFIVLTCVGLDLTPSQFIRLGQQPLVLVSGLLGPVLLLPPLAGLLLHLMAPAPHVAAGLLLVASCPIGGISNVYSYLAGASVALSVTLTALSSVLAFLTIPAISWAFERLLGQPLGFAAPASLPAQLLLMVVAPVVLGMWIGWQWPGPALRHRARMQRGAFIALAAMLAVVIGSDLDQFTAGLGETVSLAVIFVVLSGATGWLLGTAIGATSADCFTLGVEFATRNVAVATAIAVTLLGQASFAYFAATYFLTELPLMLGVVAIYRRAPRRVTV
jgi:BASS family bile acid:Na+ symporter